MSLAEAEKIAAADDELLLNLEEPQPLKDATGYGKIWLELGSGGGENLVHQAENNKDVFIIGCEPYFNGAESAIKQLKAKGLANGRMYAGDGRFLIERIPENSIDKVFILYPDPWPKKRHNNRRIINTDTLKMLHRIMKPGAELFAATDSMDYAEWILLRVFENGKFKWLAETAADFMNPPPGWISTRYEQKALAKNLKPAYLRFIKR